MSKIERKKRPISSPNSKPLDSLRSNSKQKEAKGNQRQPKTSNAQHEPANMRQPSSKKAKTLCWREKRATSGGAQFPSCFWFVALSVSVSPLGKPSAVWARWLAAD